MTRLTLRLRSFAAAVLALLAFVPLVVLALQEAYTRSLSQSMLEQLQIQSLTLISEFEMEGDTPFMPEQLFNDQLNIPESGLYAFIEIDGQVIWQSLSSLNWQQVPEFTPPVIGSELFLTNYAVDAQYFLFAYTAEFQGENDYVPVSFYILRDRKVFDSEVDMFTLSLWYWLGIIAAVLLALLFFSMNMALRPISTLINQIKEAESGQSRRINQVYPPELEKLKRSINNLLDTEEQQRSRYKNSLSDLAHSLKTPLAVLHGTESMPAQAHEPLNQIDSIIQRQLKRAVAISGAGWEQAVNIQPVAQKLRSAMLKVHRDKQLRLTVECEDGIRFGGDETDLMELLGNLFDNACKAAKSRVSFRASALGAYLDIRVDDDGPGIAPEHRQILLSRGKRLDSYREGQGIGMAVVADLVQAYQGQIEIGDATLGGASMHLKFPLPVQP